MKPKPKPNKARDEYWATVNANVVFAYTSLAYRAVRERVESYFLLMIAESKKTDGLRPTMTSLAYHLGFRNRQQFTAYKSKHKFDVMLRRAESLVENFYESKLINSNAIGSLFALKNMGWTDVMKIEENRVNEVKVTITDGKKVSKIEDGKVIELRPARGRFSTKPTKELPINGTDNE